MSETTTATIAEHRTLNTVIHAAFRRDLGRLDGALTGFPSGSRSRADQLTAAWGNVSHQLHRHHLDEESFFWPAFLELGVEPSLIDELEGEHQQMVDALDAADAAMAAFATDPSASNTTAAQDAVAELRGVLNAHLAHEERDLEPFGASHHTAKQIQAASTAARKAHTEGGGTMFAWLGDTDDASVGRALRGEMPAPVLYLLTRIGGRRYRQMSKAAWG